MSIRRIVIPEVSQIVIPEMQPINIETYIPTTSSSLHIPLPSLDLPGCVLSHRDASIKNTQIIFDDPNGSYWSCPEGQIPSYTPIEYNPKTLEIVEESEPEPISTPDPPDAVTPEIPDTTRRRGNHTVRTIAQGQMTKELAIFVTKSVWNVLLGIKEAMI